MKVLHSTLNLVPFEMRKSWKRNFVWSMFSENRFSCSREHVIAVLSIQTYAGFE